MRLYESRTRVVLLRTVAGVKPRPQGVGRCRTMMIGRPLVRPLILVCNDDGVHAPGISVLADALQVLGEVLVVAPLHQQTAAGRSYGQAHTEHELWRVPIGIEHIQEAIAVDVSPALAVTLGVLQLAPRTPALVVCGINYGENLGFAVTGSGTVGAALAAASLDCPAIASSLEAPLEGHARVAPETVDWSVSAELTRFVAAKVLRHGLDPTIAALNLNVPSGARRPAPLRVTTQSSQSYFLFESDATSGRGSAGPLRTMVRYDPASLEKDSDVWALKIDRVASVTALSRNMSAVVGWEQVGSELMPSTTSVRHLG